MGILKWRGIAVTTVHMICMSNYNIHTVKSVWKGDHNISANTSHLQSQCNSYDHLFIKVTGIHLYLTIVLKAQFVSGASPTGLNESHCKVLDIYKYSNCKTPELHLQRCCMTCKGIWEICCRFIHPGSIKWQVQWNSLWDHCYERPPVLKKRYFWAAPIV